MSCAYIFRRDLRRFDNVGFINALNDNDIVYPVFIFTPEQVTKNDYKSDISVEFLTKALEELNVKLKQKITILYGENKPVLTDFIKKNNIKALYWNEDCTHYSKNRDSEIIKLCEEMSLSYKTHNDYFLNDFDSIVSSTKSFYTVFTPYYNNAKQFKVDKINDYEIDVNILKKGKSSYINDKQHYIKNSVKNDQLHHSFKTLREYALAKLKNIKKFKKYDKIREDVTLPTSRLSAHLKFGTVSIREVFNAFRTIEPLVRQLYWRDFYSQLMYYLPKKRTIGSSNFKNLQIKWDNNKELKKAWREGKTGFPFIDAGMRELNTTGYMHNRARMACSNFYAMILLQNWKEGEKYFATKLVDYDVSQNNGNWQWNAGVGVDKSGYLRVFNPFTQSKKHDKDCAYIKKYVKELESIPAKDIHNWESKHIVYNYHPVVDYKTRRLRALKLYKNNE